MENQGTVKSRITDSYHSSLSFFFATAFLIQLCLILFRIVTGAFNLPFLLKVELFFSYLCRNF